MNNRTSGALVKRTLPDRADPARIDRLAQVSDLCSSAKEIADSLGETFLAYMISMSIEAARSEMTPRIARRKI